MIPELEKMIDVCLKFGNTEGANKLKELSKLSDEEQQKIFDVSKKVLGGLI